MSSRRRPKHQRLSASGASGGAPAKSLAQRLRDVFGMPDSPAKSKAAGVSTAAPLARKAMLEALEPRIYLSASAPWATLSGDALSLNLTDANDQVVVRQVSVSSGAAIVDITMNGITEQYSGVRSIQGDAGLGDDSLTFEDVSVALNVQGGGGNDTLDLGGAGAALSSVTYRAEKDGAGSVTQPDAAIQYAGMESLVDTRAAAQRVLISVDQNDYADGSASILDEALTLTRSSAHGVNTVLASRSNGVDSFTSIALADPTQSLSLSRDGSAASTASSDKQRSSFDVTVNGLGGLNADLNIDASKVSFQGALGLQGHALTVNAGNQITLAAGAVVSTRNVNLADPAGAELAASQNRSGNITFTAPRIQADSGAKLLSNVEGGSTYQTGNITLTAQRTEALSSAPLYQVAPGQDVSITFDHATIRGGEINLTASSTSLQWDPIKNVVGGYVSKDATIALTSSNLIGTTVDISAQAEDQNLLRELPVIGINGLTPLSELAILPIPLGTQYRAAAANVTLTDSQVTSQGDVTIESVTKVDGTVTALSAMSPMTPKGFRFGFSGSFSVVNGQANTALAGTTTITSNGNVKVSSDVTARTNAIARSTANMPSLTGLFATSDPWSVAASVALSQSTTAAHTTLDEGASISARGNVDFTAKGDVTNKAKSEVAIYSDGLAGLGVAVGVDSSDIQATVNGRITADGSDIGKALAVAGVSNASNTISMPNHGYTDGQEVVYVAPANQQPIGGLVSGNTYSVIVIDANTIALAKGGSLALNAHQAQSGATQTLTRRSAVTFNPATAVDLNTNTITIANHGWTTGQQLDYGVSEDNQALGGLVNDGSYFAIVVDANHIRLASTRESATTGVGLDLTSIGTSTVHAFAYNSPTAINFNPATSVSTGGHQITLTNHGLTTGDAVVYGVDPSIDNERVMQRRASFSVATGVNSFDPSVVTDSLPTVDVGADTIRLESTDGLVTGQRVHYSSNSLAAVGGLADGDYFAIVVDEQTIKLASTRDNALAANGGVAINLTSTGGTGSHSLVAQGVDLADNVIASPGHSFETGQQIVYRRNGNSAVGGLVDGQTYYAISVSGDLLKLATTRANASAGVAVDLTAGATGVTHSFETNTFVQLVDVTRQVPVVDTATGAIEIAGHGLVQGQQVTYSSGGGTPIGGLVDGGSYYVIVQDANHVKLASTADNATAHVGLALSAGATIGASFHSLNPTDATKPAVIFDATADKLINSAADSLYQVGHGYKTGDQVTYVTGGGTPIAGLQDGQTCFVVAVDANHFKLATTQANAQASTPVVVDIGPGATGAGQGFERASVAHVGDSAIGGLEDGTTYFVTVIDANTITLSETQDEAIAAAPIDLNATLATGTTHQLKTVGGGVNGVSITATLKAKDAINTQAGVGSAPTIKDYLTKPEILANAVAPGGRGLTSSVFRFLNKSADARDNFKNTFAGSASTVSVAGSVAFSQVNHTVGATVGSHAIVKSGGDVYVAAKVTESAQVFAQGNSSPDERKKDLNPGVPASVDKTAVAGLAVGLGFYSNTAEATVASGAVVDARKALTVDAKVSYPSLLSTYDFGERVVTDLLNGRLGLDKISNSMVLSKATDKNAEFSASGSVAVVTYTNVSRAIIGANAQINQDAAYQTSTQNVTVDAQTEMMLVNAAGVISLKLDESGLKKNLFDKKQKNLGLRGGLFSFYGSQSAGGGVGGAALVQTLDNTTVARIDSGAHVHTASAGTLTVQADENVNSIEITTSGGRAGSVGVSGSVPVLNHSSDTLAQLSAGAVIDAGDLSVTANSTANHTTIAGDIQRAQTAGFGASVGVTDIDRQVDAVIGTRLQDLSRQNVDGTGGYADIAAAAAASQINVRSTTLSATTSGAVTTVALAGAAGSPIAENSATLQGVGELAGSVVNNTVRDTTRAYVNDSGTLTLATGGDVNLTASDTTNVSAGTGALATATVPVAGFGAGLAGAVSRNDVGTVTAAFINGAHVVNADEVNLGATRSGSVTAGAAGLGTAGSLGGAALAAAGSVSLNEVDNWTRSFVSNSQVTSNKVRLNAADTSSATAGSGTANATRAGFQSASVGASAGDNHVTSEVGSTVIRSTVSGTQSVDLIANAGLNVSAYTFGFASSIGSLAGAGAGAGSGNTVTSTVEARVAAKSNVSSAKVALSATDTSTIVADAGGFALARSLAVGAGQLSVGIGAAVNTITANVVAEANDSQVNGGAQGVTLTATSTASIQALTLGGAVGRGGAVTGAGAGAGSNNTVHSGVHARLANGALALVDQGGGLTLTATDGSTIVADAGGFSIAAASGMEAVNGAVGVSVALNNVSDTTEAVIDQSRAIVSGAVALSATSTAHIDALSMTGELSATYDAGFNGAAGGAGADNAITSSILAKTNQADVEAGGNVSLAATDTSTITANTLGGSLAASFASAASVAISVAHANNTIRNTVQASIEGKGSAQTGVVAGGSLSLTANSTATIDAKSVSVAIAASLIGTPLSGGGSNAVNVVDNTVRAFVSGNASARAAQNVNIHAIDSATITTVVPDISIAGSVYFEDVPPIAVGVSLSSNTISNDVDAYVASAAVTSTGGDVDLAASSVRRADALNIVGSISGIVGTGADAKTLIEGHTNAHLDAQAAVTAAHAVRITSTLDGTAKSDVRAGAGAALSVNAMLASAKVTASTKASVGDSATVNAGSLVVRTYTLDNGGQPVATSRKATANVTVGTVAVLGGNGGKSSAEVSGDVEASVLNAAVTLNGGNALVDAKSTASTDAHMPGGSGGGLAISAMLTDATVSGATRASVGGTINTQGTAASGGDLSVQAHATNTITADLLGVAIGANGGSGGKANAQYTGQTEAKIQDGATISHVHDLSVNAGATNTVSTDARGGAGSALVTVDGFEAVSTLGGANGAGSTHAGVGNVNSVDARSLSTTAQATNTATSNLLAVGIGAIAGSGGKATTSVTANVQADVLAPAKSVTVAGSTSVTATSNETDTATAKGGAGGLLSVSALLADAQSHSNTEAKLNASLNTGSVDVEAQAATRNVSAVMDFGGVSVLQNAGGRADTKADGNVNAQLGGTVNSSGDVKLQANNAQSHVNSRADGWGGGGIAISVFESTANLGGATTATVLDGANISARNFNQAATALNYVDATMNTKGIGIGAGAGGAADTTVNTRTEAAFGQGQLTQLSATGQADILALSDERATTHLNGESDGGLSVGSVNSTLSVTNTTNAFVGNGAKINQASRVSLRSSSNSLADADASCFAGALIPVALTAADVTVHDDALTKVGDGAVISSTGDVVVNAAQLIQFESTARSDARGAGGSRAEARRRIDTTVNTTIGSADITAQNLDITARQQGLTATTRGDAQAALGAVGVGSLATASTVAVNIGANAHLTARNLATLGAYQDKIETQVDGHGAILGVATGDATDTVTLNTSVTAAAGSTIRADRGLSVDAQVTAAPKVLANGGAGSLTDNRTIDFNAVVSTQIAPDPELVIEADGTVSKQTNVTYSRSGNTVVVDAVTAQPDNTPTITFKLNPGTSGTGSHLTLRGTGSVALTNYGTVSLTNKSNAALQVNGIDLIASTNQLPDKVSVDVVRPAGFLSTRSAGTNDLTPSVRIDNQGTGDVRLNGGINNPNGSVAVSNTGGNVTADSAAEIRAKSIAFNVAQGSIGAIGASGAIHTNTHDLSAQAGTGLSISNQGGDLNLHGIRSSTGTVNLSTSGSLKGDASISGADISGQNLVLNATQGSIGTDQQILRIAADQLAATASGDIVVNDVSDGLSLGSVSSSAGHVAISTADTASSVNETLTVRSGSTVQAAQGTVSLRAGDQVLAEAGSTITAAGLVTIEGGTLGLGSRIDLRGDIEGSAVHVNGGGGQDVVSLRGVQHDTTVATGAGDDVIYVGSAATQSGNTGGRLDDIDATLTIQGGEGADRLLLDDSGDTGNTGALTTGSVTGLGTSSGIQFGGIENLSVAMGSGADTFSVINTDAGMAADIRLGGGDDQVLVGDTAGAVKNGLNGVQGGLTISGEGGSDTLRVSDLSSGPDATAPNSGQLQADRLTGLGMDAAGLTYGGFESLDLTLGDGVDHLAVGSVSTATAVHAGAGADVITVGDMAPTSSLSAIVARLQLDAGADGAALIVNSGALAQLTLDSQAGAANAVGVITQAGSANGRIEYQGFDSLAVSLGNADDSVTVNQTVTALSLDTGAGADVVAVNGTAHVANVDLGSGSDTITVRGNSAPLNIKGGDAGSDVDEVIVDVSTSTQAVAGSLTGTAAGAQLSGVTAGAVNFDGVERLALNLGQGNDALELNEQLDATRVIVNTGGGDDAVQVRSLGAKLTSINGQEGNDTVTVHVDGAPVADAFTQLGLGVETLVVDNSANTTTPVNWTVVDGDHVDAQFGSGEQATVVTAAGAAQIRILGGTQSDTLTVQSTTSSDVQGAIDGNRVTLDSGAAVLVPGGFKTLPNGDSVIDFDALQGSSAAYNEDGFRLQAGNGGSIALNTERGTAASVASGTTLTGTTGALSLVSVMLASDSAAPVTVQVTGTTLNGKQVTATFTVDGRDAATGRPVFKTCTFADPAFGVLNSATFTVTGGGLLMDSVVARALATSGAVAAIPTVVQKSTLAGNVFFDTANLRIVIDTNGNQQYDNGETVYASNATTGPVQFVAVGGSVVQFQFVGDLEFANGSHVYGKRGSANGVSLQANDITIGSNVVFDFAAVGSVAGAGGGGGGSAGSGGGGGAGGGGQGGGSGGGGGAGGYGYQNGFTGGGGGTPGGYAGTGNAGQGASASGSGGNGVGTTGGGGAAGAAGGSSGSGGGGGYAQGSGGSGGNGGSGGWIYTAGNGSQGGSATGPGGSSGQSGSVGLVGNGGLGGQNLAAGSDISGGGGGGAGGSGGGGSGGGGGGGGSGGGGGGGGGGLYSPSTADPGYPSNETYWTGGHGAQGGSGGTGQTGGTGGTGGQGGAGGGGGGALELRAVGRIRAGDVGVSFTAKGGNGGNGAGGNGGGGGSGNTSPGYNGYGQSDGGATDISGQYTGNGAYGGSGTYGGAGGQGGRGGNGAGGGGGAGGTIKLVASVLNNISSASIDVSGGSGGTGERTGATGSTGRNIQVSGSGTTLADNPYVVDRSGAATLDDTPRVAGLAGGADLFGLLSGVSKSDVYFSSTTQGVAGIPATQSDAIAAVVRTSAMPGTGDTYPGYDVLLFVSLSGSINLDNPQLGITLDGVTSSFKTSLKIDGQGALRDLGTLGQGQVWATLIPHDVTTVTVNASVDLGGRTHVYQGGLAQNSVQYIKFAQASVNNTNASLPGLSEMAVSPDGSRIYAVSPQSSALVVLNADDRSERQVLRNGYNGISGLNAVSDLSVSADGRYVYVSSPTDGITVFAVGLQNGQPTGTVSLVGSLTTNGLKLSDAVAASPVTGSTSVFSVGIDGIQRSERNAQGGLTTGLRTTGFAADSVAVSQDGTLVYAGSRTGDKLYVIDATTLQVQQTISGATQGIDGISAISISANGSFVYVSNADSDSVSVFKHDASGLSLVQAVVNGHDGVRGLRGASDVVITPDQRMVLVTGAAGNSVAVFSRDPATGELEFLQTLRDGVSGLDGLTTPTTIATNANGAAIFVGSAGSADQAAGITTFSNAALGVALPDRAEQVTTFQGVENLAVQLGSGNDDLVLTNAPDAGVTPVSLSTGGGSDTVMLADLVNQTNVDLGTGNDTAQLSATRSGTQVSIAGGSGQDLVEINAAGEGSQINVIGGAGADTVRVSGTDLPATSSVVLDASDTDVAPYDTLIFDPRNAVANTPNWTPQVPTLPGGELSVTGHGTVNYSHFENVQIVSAPLVSIVPPGPINEGDGLHLQASVTPLGSTNSLKKPLEWFINGKQIEDTGNDVTVSWSKLQELGVADDGHYQIAARATDGDGAVSTAYASLTINNTLPTVVLTGAANAVAGKAYTVTFGSTDPGDDRVTDWLVNWGDGSTESLGSNARSATHVYTEPGAYTVQVGATDEDTVGRPTLSNAVSVRASVTASQVQAGGPYQIAEGQDLTLAGSTVGTPVSWSWDLNGDGKFDDATAPNAVVSWTALQDIVGNSGTYSVRLRVAYANGDVVTSDPVLLSIANVAPTATLTNSGPVTEGSTATVSFVDATDPSKADLANLRYSVDFDNDGQFDVVNSTSSTFVVDSKYLKQDGVQTIRGRVSDLDGGYTDLATKLTVQEVAPTLIVTGDATVAEGAAYHLNLSAQDPGADSIGRWTVDWADGVVETFIGPVQSLTHRFRDDGVRHVQITATDQDGTYSATQDVSVSNVPPTLQLSQKGVAVEGLPTRFTGVISDPGVADDFTLQVNWGDGNTENLKVAAGTQTFELSHVFADDQTYAINTVLTDKDGGSSAGTLAVTVGNQAPVILGLAPAAPQVSENSTVTLTGFVSDAGLLDSHTVVVDWGDGNTSNAQVDAATRQLTATHVYADDAPTGTQSDRYNIVATVTDNAGSSSQASTSVLVVNEAPAITALKVAEQTTTSGLLATLTGSFADVGALDTHSLQIVWGDGTSEFVGVDESGHGFVAQHTYAPSQAPGQAAGYRITANLSDDDGGSSSASVNTAGYPVNHAPVAGNDSAVVVINTPTVLNLKANDSDADGDALTLLVLDAPAHGALKLGADGSYTYVPTAGYLGNDSFTYQLSDGQLASNVATVSIRVRNPSEAHDDAVSTNEDNAVVINVLANDIEVNTATVVNGPQHGTLTARADGSFTYTPNADYFGADSFTYKSDDPFGIRTEAVVSITVNPVNDAPVVNAISNVTVNEGQVVNLQVVASDIDSPNLSYSVVGSGASIDKNGRLSFNAADGNAVVPVTVSVSDGELTTQRSFNVNVLNVAPTLSVTGSATVLGGQPYVVKLAASDPGQDTISKWLVNWGDGTVQTLAGNATQASHVYTRAGGAFSVQVTATDEDGSYAATPLSVAVKPDLLKVLSFNSTATGFNVRFDHTFDASTIGLYANLGSKPDVQLKGASTGVVTGSLVLDADGQGFTFIRTGGVLKADTYTVTLASNSAAFKDSISTLDGNGDGLAGDDYVKSFVFNPASNATVISLPDFMRGPGQPVNVPALGQNLPVTLTTPGGAHQVVFTVDYNPSMLSVTGAKAAFGMPLGTTVVLDSLVNADGSKRARVTVTLPGSLTLLPGSWRLVDLVTSVPATAPYGASEVMRVGISSINGAAPAAGSVVSDNALHVVGYYGDANGDAKYTLDDYNQILRVVNKTDSGFAAWRNTDPVQIAGVSGGNALSAFDATSVLQNIGLPSIPAVGMINFANQGTTVTTASTLSVQSAAATSFTTLSASSLTPVSASTVNAASSDSTTVTSSDQNGGSFAAQPVMKASSTSAAAPVIDFGRTGGARGGEPELKSHSWLAGFLSEGGGASKRAHNLKLKVTIPPVVSASDVDRC